ncbi:MAG: PH domain-containing protein [Legionellaceae bacterium]|nr:PH domain-containing protein [Legionellaceae bacterium]
MVERIKDDDIIYKAKLHWILFIWPVLFFCVAVYIGMKFEPLQKASLFLGAAAIFWEVVVWLTYECSYLIIKNKQVILCTGIFVRQTLDLSLNKIESVDIRQSILGSILQYGSLVITGTGGTRQYINFLNKPLTCRRYIEQALHN